MNTRLFIIAITPAISIAVAVYLSDRYDREPISLLAKTFIFGALSVIPTIIVERFLSSINIFSGLLGIAFTAFVVAGFTEEFFKRLVVLKLMCKDKHFDEKLDGIVYAVFSALGFATVENIMYVVFRFSYNPYIGLYRGILSVPAHAIFGVTMGYYLSLTKFASNKARERANHRKSLYMPLILHGTFNFILMAGIPQFGIVLAPFVIYLWISSQRKLNTYIFDSQSRFDRLNLDDEE
ncbi:Membrane proteinase PrsW, cleaves anti-sigma factor RsiW, M82 family [Proteiniborus ethanoligenes]|uniref:Protease PrsW n=1 Tax=Proteiniborus ethanoligenes TaxID=415015 RepID=A0A1H3Q8S1_9FIRM|nr:PrsW family glutamic-type intramembrane protease [Proteiniborus ethanoligenes]SDZ09777.1 Membrane proteinase PrsW, cleaves anti-sigma factor RsiW, M82 family [Proteiniborus ethanoligenes]